MENRFHIIIIYVFVIEKTQPVRGNLTIKFSGCYEGTAIAAHISLYCARVSA